MGFGTLFTGYFLILNVTYYGFSDFLAAFIMLYGLYKLSFVNKSFKFAMYSMCAFAIFSIYELIVFVLDMFLSGMDLGILLTVTASLRALLLCLSTVMMLLGMRDVCYEVDLKALGRKCHYSILPVFIIYSLTIVLEAGGNFSFIPTKYIALLAVFVMLAGFVMTVINLKSIYSCYAKICMPNEENGKKKSHRTSKFVESFRRHEEEKQREYFEYKMNKRQAKQNKNNSDGKKK